MDFDEPHRAAMSGENCDRGEAERSTPDGERAGRGRWNRGRAVHSGVAEAVHDVGRFDPGPHDDPHLGEGGPDAGEFGSQCLLGVIDRPSFGEERIAAGGQLGSRVGAVYRAPVAARVSGGIDESHGCFSVLFDTSCSGKRQQR